MGKEKKERREKRKEVKTYILTLSHKANGRSTG
jgi:hypothetical protein